MPTLMEKRDAAVKAAQALVEKARNEGLNDQETQEMKSLVDQAKSLEEKIKEAHNADELLKSFGQPISEKKKKEARETVAGKSFGAYAVEGFQKQGALENIKSRRRVQADLPEFLPSKANTDVVTTGNAIGAEHLLLPDIDTNIVKQYVQRPTIASWLGAGNLTSNAIVYFVEKVWDVEQNGNFATVGENEKKPQLSAPGYDEVTETLKKIAGWIVISMEMAEDANFLVSEIENRLLYQLLMVEEDQLLNGDGLGNNVKGLLKREGLQKATSAGDDLDAIYKAQNAIFTKTGLRADGMVIHPTDYEKLRLSKDGNGQYLAGGAFQGQYGNGPVLQDPPIWGLPTIVTTAIKQGTVLIGAGKVGATVYRKGGLRVEASNVNGEDFTHNRFTILSEERLTLAVRKPDAFIELTLSAGEEAAA